MGVRRSGPAPRPPRGGGGNSPLTGELQKQARVQQEEFQQQTLSPTTGELQKQARLLQEWLLDREQQCGALRKVLLQSPNAAPLAQLLTQLPQAPVFPL